MWVSDTASHFKNGGLLSVADTLRTSHHFAVAGSAWTNGTVGRMMREIIRKFRALLNEARRVLDWLAKVVPVAKWALNAACRERLHASPYKAMFGREPETSFSTFLECGDYDWDAGRLEAEREQHTRSC